MKTATCDNLHQDSPLTKEMNTSGSPEEAVTGEVRMDVGPIHRKLLAYAAPLLLMQLMLQFYNIADCAVVGWFGGAFGLAAVGVAGLVLAVHINFFIGFGVGVTSAVSRLFGARQYEKLRHTIATSVVIATVAGIFLTLLGEILGRRYLLWLSCPAEAMGDALLYLRICLIGLVPQLVYNVANGVLRALGMTDTQKIGLMGHSIGGAVSMDMARQRDDISAVIDIDGTMLGEEKADGSKFAYNPEPFQVPLLAPGFRMVVFSVVIMVVVLFFRKGIMGDRELWELGSRRGAKEGRKKA